MRRDALIIAEMIEACDRATSLTDQLKQAEPADAEPWALVAALSWQFTVIGEAARQVSEELRRHTRTSLGLAQSAHGTSSRTPTGGSTSPCSPTRRSTTFRCCRINCEASWLV